MNRRKFLLGMGTAAAGSGVVFGSGAFTQTQVDRDVRLQFDNDANAAVSIAVGDDPSNVASQVDSGNSTNQQIQLDFGSSDDGMNVDGVSLFRDVLQITNNNNDDDADIILAAASGDTGDYQRARGRVLATTDNSKLSSQLSGSSITADNIKDISAENDLYSSDDSGPKTVTKDLRFALKDGSPYEEGTLKLGNSNTTNLSFEFEAGENTRTSNNFTYNFRLKAFSAQQYTQSDLDGNKDVFVDQDLAIQYNNPDNVDSF